VLPPPLAVGLSVVEPARVAPGQTVALKIHVHNRESLPLRGAKLVVRLPQGLRHEAGEEIEADLGDLEPGCRSIDLRVTAALGGHWPIEATARAQGAQASAKASVEVSASLVLRKRGPSVLVRGQQAEYAIEVVNQGSSEQVGVMVGDRLPPGLDMVAAGGGGIFDAVGRAVQWKVGNLPPGQSKTLTLKVAARAAGEQINRVWAQATGGQDAHLTSDFPRWQAVAAERATGKQLSIIDVLQRFALPGGRWLAMLFPSPSQTTPPTDRGSNGAMRALEGERIPLL
jgi:uncharacterized repeat protein (TIGR01451 family)